MIGLPPHEQAHRVEEAELVASLIAGEPLEVPLLLGATGMGKSVVLNGGARRAATRHMWDMIRVRGVAVASEEHLAAQLAAHVAPVGRTVRAPYNSRDALADVLDALGRRARPTLLVCDDIDVLLYKRRALGQTLCNALRAPSLRLVASASAEAAERLQEFGRDVSAATGLRVRVIHLDFLPDTAVRALARRRNPALAQAVVECIVQLAAGHPAAVAFLARLLAATGASGTVDAARAVLGSAGEFAGAVYAGPWAALGPQQRAVITALAAFGGPASPSDLARRLYLPASQVSAQLSRLRMEALIQHAGRGQFTVAGLLTQWLTRDGSAPGSCATFTGREAPAGEVAGGDALMNAAIEPATAAVTERGGGRPRPTGGRRRGTQPSREARA